ncbi:MAG: ABC transporter permease subunit, partial [Proteobacteria bacterium]|nr:ABC transporter permease subunit [Pseudomonadota bacterium]
MLAYILRRLLLMIPTLFGIMLISFTIVQFAPGGPIERVLAQLQGNDMSATARFTGGTGDLGQSAQLMQPGGGDGSGNKYRGAQGLDPKFLKQLEAQFGFDKPAHERFFQMLGNYLRFDFGKSYFRDISVLELIKEKLPVSVSLGVWMTLLSYGISIPLGIRKAMQDGSRFDVWTSALVIIGYAIPGFLFAILLIVLFGEGSSFLPFFPLRGLTSEQFSSLPWWGRILDYLHHIALPILAMALGAFATSTLLTKNSFLDEIKKHYVLTARMKGLSESEVLYG